MNSYGYVMQNPINIFDSNGLYGSNANFFSSSELFGSLSGCPVGGSVSFGSFKDNGRTCTLIKTCRRFTLGIQIAVGMSLTGSVRGGPLCSGTFTTYGIFAEGKLLGGFGRASAGFGKNSATITATAGVGKSALPAFVGIEVCEITLKCQKPEPCECTGR